MFKKYFLIILFSIFFFSCSQDPKLFKLTRQVIGKEIKDIHEKTFAPVIGWYYQDNRYYFIYTTQDTLLVDENEYNDIKVGEYIR